MVCAWQAALKKSNESHGWDGWDGSQGTFTLFFTKYIYHIGLHIHLNIHSDNHHHNRLGNPIYTVLYYDGSSHTKNTIVQCPPLLSSTSSFNPRLLEKYPINTYGDHRPPTYHRVLTNLPGAARQTDRRTDGHGDSKETKKKPVPCKKYLINTLYNPQNKKKKQKKQKKPNPAQPRKQTNELGIWEFTMGSMSMYVWSSALSKIEVRVQHVVYVVYVCMYVRERSIYASIYLHIAKSTNHSRKNDRIGRLTPS